MVNIFNCWSITQWIWPLLGEAIIFKINQDFNWFYIGALALIVFNSGICFVGKAILLKIEMSKNN